MAKKQTRRCISLSGATYDVLKVHCEATQQSMSGVVETLVQNLLGTPERPKAFTTYPESRRSGNVKAF